MCVGGKGGGVGGVVERERRWRRAGGREVARGGFGDAGERMGGARQHIGGDYRLGGSECGDNDATPTPRSVKPNHEHTTRTHTLHTTHHTKERDTPRARTHHTLHTQQPSRACLHLQATVLLGQFLVEPLQSVGHLPCPVEVLL